MRGHNFEFKGIESPNMMSTMKSNFRDTKGLSDPSDLLAA
jgi:hypothetical protein